MLRLLFLSPLFIICWYCHFFSLMMIFRLFYAISLFYWFIWLFSFSSPLFSSDAIMMMPLMPLLPPSLFSDIYTPFRFLSDICIFFFLRLIRFSLLSPCHLRPPISFRWFHFFLFFADYWLLMLIFDDFDAAIISSFSFIDAMPLLIYWLFSCFHLFRHWCCLFSPLMTPLLIYFDIIFIIIIIFAFIYLLMSLFSCRRFWLCRLMLPLFRLYFGRRRFIFDWLSITADADYADFIITPLIISLFSDYAFLLSSFADYADYAADLLFHFIIIIFIRHLFISISDASIIWYFQPAAYFFLPRFACWFSIDADFLILFSLMLIIDLLHIAIYELPPLSCFYFLMPRRWCRAFDIFFAIIAADCFLSFFRFLSADAADFASFSMLPPDLFAFDWYWWFWCRHLFTFAIISSSFLWFWWAFALFHFFDFSPLLYFHFRHFFADFVITMPLIYLIFSCFRHFFIADDTPFTFDWCQRFADDAYWLFSCFIYFRYDTIIADAFIYLSIISFSMMIFFHLPFAIDYFIDWLIIDDIFATLAFLRFLIFSFDVSIAFLFIDYIFADYRWCLWWLSILIPLIFFHADVWLMMMFYFHAADYFLHACLMMLPLITRLFRCLLLFSFFFSPMPFALMIDFLELMRRLCDDAPFRFAAIAAFASSFLITPFRRHFSFAAFVSFDASFLSFSSFSHFLSWCLFRFIFILFCFFFFFLLLFISSFWCRFSRHWFSSATIIIFAAFLRHADFLFSPCWLIFLIWFCRSLFSPLISRCWCFHFLSWLLIFYFHHISSLFTLFSPPLISPFLYAFHYTFSPLLPIIMPFRFSPPLIFLFLFDYFLSCFFLIFFFFTAAAAAIFWLMPLLRFHWFFRHCLMLLPRH